MNNLGQAFTYVANHPHLLLTKLGGTLVICVEALIISLLIGLPLGLVLGHLHRFSFFAINSSNVGRALPSLAVLSFCLLLIGVGHVDIIIALVILAFPPILTNTYTAIEQVDPDAVEAAKGMGLRPLQVILKVELPMAVPLIFAGIRTSAVFVVATSPLSGQFGGGGLGDIIIQRTLGLPAVIGASYVVIVLAFAVQGGFILLERLVTPAGLKRRNRRDRTIVAGPDLDVGDEELIASAA